MYYTVIGTSLFVLATIAIGYFVGRGFEIEMTDEYTGRVKTLGAGMTIAALLAFAAIAALAWPLALLVGGGYFIGKYVHFVRVEADD